MGILVGEWYPITKVDGIDIGFSHGVRVALNKYVTCDMLSYRDTHRTDDPAYLVILRIIDICVKNGIHVKYMHYEPVETLELLFDFTWKNPILVFKNVKRETRVALWRTAFEEPDRMQRLYPELYTDRVVEGMKEVVRVINRNMNVNNVDEDTENLILETIAGESPYLEKYVLQAICSRLGLSIGSVGAQVAVVENGYCYLNPDRMADVIIREAKNACD